MTCNVNDPLSFSDDLFCFSDPVSKTHLCRTSLNCLRQQPQFSCMRGFHLTVLRQHPEIPVTLCRAFLQKALDIIHKDNLVIQPLVFSDFHHSCLRGWMLINVAGETQQGVNNKHFQVVPGNEKQICGNYYTTVHQLPTNRCSRSVPSDFEMIGMFVGRMIQIGFI